MSSHFHLEAGPFTIDVEVDDTGLRVERGAISQTIAWGKISAATLIREIHRDETREELEEVRAAQFLGPAAIETKQALGDSVGQIALAYRDEKNQLRHTEIPAPLTDVSFLQEFEIRLGPRWLGESSDRQQAVQRLHTNPGIFKTMFVLVALAGIIGVVAALALFGFLGPLFSFLSLQKMLLDLQDGNYPSFASRLATYLALLVIAYFLHRVIRTRLDSLKSRFAPGRAIQS